MRHPVYNAQFFLRTNFQKKSLDNFLGQKVMIMKILQRQLATFIIHKTEVYGKLMQPPEY